jgi:tetratricopeptide (TPR) repeat protein
VPDEIEDENAAEAEYMKASAEYEKAMAARHQIPVVGDNFFKFASFSPDAFYRPLLSISAFYVPLAILVMCAFAPIGSFGLVLRRDYGPVSTCVLMAWAAAHLPFAIVGIVLHSRSVDPVAYFSLWMASSLLFVVFAAFALRTVLGTGMVQAIAAAAIGLFGFTIGMYAFRYISPWLFSPFILFYAYSYFGGEVRGFGNAFRQRQNFKRFLHNATVNPRDADAHVQLGLIYLQRRQEAKALDHFARALEIDPKEIEANYELGKIARQKGDLQRALDHFSVVVEQDDKHSLSEIWREIGAAYLTAEMFSEAREALERFVERRPYDPEGLYYLGKSLKSLGENDHARSSFEKAVESVKGSPDYRRRTIKHWGKLAEKEI